LTNDPTPAFAFSSSEAGSTFQCRIDFALPVSCTSPFTTQSLADGTYTFGVSATGPSGLDQTPATRVFTIDTAAPETTIDTAPADPTNDSTPEFTFSASEAGPTFECKVDSEAFAPCTSPHATAELAPGSHTFAVQATDVAGNQDATAATASFTIDTTAPDTTITAGPAGSTTDPTATVTFSSDGSGSSFECQVDAGEFASCVSPFVTQSLAAGVHTIAVRALDAAGNADPTPATRTFTVALPTGTNVGPGPAGPSPTVQARVLRRLTLAPSRRLLAHGSALRLNGSLKSNAGRRSCQSRQKIALQRRKLTGGRFQTFEVAVTTASGSFRAATRPVRTYLYRARVSQTVRCMGATSKTARVVVRKRSKAARNRA
jgi:hypothetical protein